MEMAPCYCSPSTEQILQNLCRHKPRVWLKSMRRMASRTWLERHGPSSNTSSSSRATQRLQHEWLQSMQCPFASPLLCTGEEGTLGPKPASKRWRFQGLPHPHLLPAILSVRSAAPSQHALPGIYILLYILKSSVSILLLYG